MIVIKPKDIEAAFRVGIVVSRYNEQITQRLYEGALIRLNELKITSDFITVVWVPGAVEIPIAAQTDRYWRISRHHCLWCRHHG